MKSYFLVIDGFGVGADPQAGSYGDEGSNTALSVSRAIPGPKWDFLRRLGFGNLCEMQGFALCGCSAVSHPLASSGALAKRGEGKDTSTGHWELAGLESTMSLRLFPPTYPSFPAELVKAIEERTGRKVIGNCSASGTKIIQQLGEEQCRDGSLICYTSADSVVQIAAHEECIPHEDLHDICRMVREICDPYRVGRVIARPFVGNPQEGFVRTAYRKDFSIALPGRTYLEDYFAPLSVPVIGIGKIGDLFQEQGLTQSYPEKGNAACWKCLLQLAQQARDARDGADAFYFVNLVDTDMQYGHRRNAVGYCEEIERISQNLEILYDLMEEGDVLCVTADHGCDPCFIGTDHTREWVPELFTQKGKRESRNLGRRNGFAWAMRDVLDLYADVAATKGKPLVLPWQES